jgi:hypothetical protein
MLEMAKTLVLGHRLESRIDLRGSCDLGAPVHKMVLENSFVELVQDIRGNTYEDVGEWEIGPERVIDRTKTFIIESRYANPRRLLVKDVRCSPLIPQPRIEHLSTTIWWYTALRAMAFLAACNETLLRVICNVCCQDRVDATNPSICTDHLHAVFSWLDQRLQDLRHAVMKQPVSCDGTRRFLEAIQFRNWNVPNQNCRMGFWLPADCLCDVPNGKIHRPCALIASEQRQPCLV